MQHYRVGKIQAIDVIQDWALDFAYGNVLKYLARAEHKEQATEDRIKALWYLAYAVTRSTDFADRVSTDAREIVNGN